MINAYENNSDAMADQRDKIGQEVITACRDFYIKFEGSSSISCRQGGYKECDFIFFGALHKAFKSINLHPSDAELQAHLALDAIVKTIKSAMDEVKQSINKISVSGSSRHYICGDPADEFVWSLQTKLGGIEPLHLMSFSKKPAALEAKSEWTAFLLKEATFSSIQTTGPEIFRLSVCKYGDMEIVLKTNTIHATYVVSSHQLRAGSPVFRDLLGQDSAFVEHNSCRYRQTPDSGLNANSNRGHYQLQLKKDHDLAALSIVLFILHARVQALPESVHFDNLIIILAICDYYDCSVVLQPWQGKWIESWRKHLGSPGYEDWLYVSWVFREDQTFQTLTKKLSESGVVEDDEFVFIVKEEPVRDVKYLSKFIPQMIIGMTTNPKIQYHNILTRIDNNTDAMIEQRNAAGEKMIQAFRDIYEQYNIDNDTTSRCRTMPHSNTRKICDRYIYGELHLGFKAARLLADGLSFRSDISINRAVADLNKLSTVLRLNLNCNIGGYIHSSCSVISTELTRIAQNALTDIKPLPLTTFGRKQAEKQVVTWNSVLA